jgi:hypothetical protein
VIDYVDHGRRDYTSYDRVDDFDDKASAARWCLPAAPSLSGQTAVRWPRGRSRRHGTPDLDADFGDAQRRRPPIRDEVSCSRWLHGRYSLTTTLRWAA